MAVKFLITIVAILISCEAQATVLNGATCQVEAIVKFAGTEKEQLCSDGVCKDYDSPYITVVIDSVHNVSDCGYVNKDDEFKINSGGDLSLLSVGDKFTAGTELSSSMTISGAVSFIQWSNIKIIQGDKTLPDNYGLQGEAAPIKASK